MKSPTWKRFLRSAVIFLVIAGVVVVFAFPQPRYTVIGWITGEPFQFGKPLSLVMHRVEHGDVARRMSAISSLWIGTCAEGDDGEEAPPFAAHTKQVVSVLLGVQTDDPDLEVRASSLNALGRIAVYHPNQQARIIPVLQAGLNDPATQYDCAKNLGDIGAAALPAVPQLMACFLGAESGEARSIAKYAIYKLSPASIPELLELMKTADTKTVIRKQGYTARAWVFFMLREIARQGAIGARAKDCRVVMAENAASVLADALEDDNPAVHEEAARALAAIGPEIAAGDRTAADAVIAKLSAALEPNPGADAERAYPKSWEFYNGVAEALGEIGSAAAPHVERLRQLGGDERHPARKALRKAVETISMASQSP